MKPNLFAAQEREAKLTKPGDSLKELERLAFAVCRLRSLEGTSIYWRSERWR